MMNDETKKKVLTRLKRAEGQVAGIRRMVEQGEYCVDILTQIAAAQAALGQAGNQVLSRHIETCVAESFKTGSNADREQKIAEIMDIFSRFSGTK
jgi:DNA-binding FrmR family transcriptional regulator